MNEIPQIDQFNDPLRYRDGDLPEPQSSEITPYIPMGLRQTKISDIQSRSDLVRELAKQIPVNEYGLPQYYYRPDMLDKDLLLTYMEQQKADYVDKILQSAVYPISYGQGFPTQPDNNPVWGQMPWEDKEAYDAFTQYLELEGIRNLAAIISIKLDLLGVWFDTNYWFSRAKAYDVFKFAHHARVRENRIMKLENDHWVEGEKIFRKLVNAIGNKTAEELNNMEVDKLISSLERVTKIQNSAVGRSNTGRNSDGETPKVPSVEVVMRQVTGDQSQKVESDEFDASLLSDPEVLAQAQELIIKVNK